MPGARTWTDEDLRRAVAAASNLSQVFRQLGLVPGGEQWQTMQDHILRLGLGTAHWRSPLPRRRPSRTRSWTDTQLVGALRDARSLAEVMRHLGIRGGGAQTVVKRRIAQLGLDTSHLTGQGWARGRSNPSGRKARPLDELLVRGSAYRNTTRLRDRLINEGVLDARCEECGLHEWNGRPAPLQLDHIDGDRRNNLLENLRLLCPNCHAQTDTYCGRNQGRYADRTP